MLSDAPAVTVSRRRLLAGRILTALPALFLLWDSSMKLLSPTVVVETFARLGYADGVARPLGILQLACLGLYVLPRTSVLGAILLTGFLGGAVATHVRVGDPLMSHALFPVYVGILIWGGLYLRDGRLQALIPVR